MKAAGVVLAALGGAFLLLAAGFRFGATAVYRWMDYRASRRAARLERTV